MENRISFLCPSCKARLRASIRLATRSLACPGCQHAVVVPLRVPAEQAPMLVFDDGDHRPRSQPKWVC
jgi:DNA-directed RNA polymerase subunit RPC12/RpoP